MPRERRHLTSASRWKVGLLGLVLCAPVGPNFFTFDESKPKDPGRRELRHEFSGVGEERLLLPLSCGGTLSVRGYEASEQQVPKGWPSGSYQEWRSLIFEPAETEDAGPPFIQSVSKVTCCPDGRWFPEADPQVLALNYPKTLGAAVAASLKLLHVERPKILVIGLGSSAVPLWLAELFPDSQVDVVELEGTVIQAASEVLGFPIEVPGAGDRNLSPLRGRMGQRLRAIEGDGAALAQRWAADKGTRYDAVLIDAYDSLNRVPQPLWIEDGPLAQALPRLLEEVGVVAANVPPGFPTLRLIASYLQALGTDAQETPALTFEVPETMNTVAVVLRGAQVDVPLIALQEEAKKLVEGGDCLIDAFSRLTDCQCRQL
ncbi:Polyamine aminopropyltransferase (Putrescine aminopropyltransferase) (PAPT) (Spermidine synthase) (SPDS) (SPDSY) [Durusdinium trenchii]|uniref:Polyamine aminopropyltransferase (Putrescine aminopropyltransferase) (PAPT) (Spermidine synthase) (SPDS) (SPDSY) n=1 Tax=Durusdinium trenchii TaxID=1381693 RepID=A0ABP0LBD9_9DINO